MPGIRSPGQTFIGAWFDESFLAKVDKARGTMSRSQFFRNAISEKLHAMGYKVGNEANAPDRAGVGGPRKLRESVGSGSRYPQTESETMSRNDAPSPKVKAAADKVEAILDRRARERERKEKS